MVEKWTAADEKLFQELGDRRRVILDRQYNALFRVMNDVFDRDSLGETLTNMIAHASTIHAALEPFVLAAGEKDNEA